MASIVETKAVALRRGNHSENLAFTGVQGEVSVDLGYEDVSGNLGTDSNTTLRLHNGITKGGIPMARADLLNINSAMLAENRNIVNDKNLAYADLSNLETTEDPSTVNKILSALSSYGIAIESEVQERLDNKVDLDTSNLNTLYLTSEEIHNGENGNSPLAYANTSNINTSNLVSNIYHDGENGNSPLAYANTSNINTANLVDETYHDGEGGNLPLAYADLSNVNTENLVISPRQDDQGPVIARADLENVEHSALIPFLEDPELSIEIKTNKDIGIDPENVQLGHYPETGAVIDYIDETLEKIDFFSNTDLTNVEDWNPIFYNEDAIIFSYNGTIANSTDGFQLEQQFETSIPLVNDLKGNLNVTIESVDENGAIQSLILKYDIGDRDLSSVGTLHITSTTNTNASFTINSTDNGDGTYTYSIDNILNGGSGFTINSEYDVKDENNKKIPNVVYKKLYITVESVDENGAILNVIVTPKYGLTHISDSITITSEELSADITISSNVYNENGGPSVLKSDLTNLDGMTDEDKTIETDSPWRIRHDEDIPSLTNTTIPNSQNYNIATNGSVWRALKSFTDVLSHIPSVTFIAKFIPNNDYTSEDDIVLVDRETSDFTLTSEYGHSTSEHYSSYMLFPNHEYGIQIKNGNQLVDNYIITTGDVGTTTQLDYSLANVTINLNVQTATIEITRLRDDHTTTFEIIGGTFSRMITNDCTWTISKEGYSSVYGNLEVHNGDQTFNITLDEESL